MYTVPFSAGILVAQGDHVDKGQELTSGALNPHDVLRIRGIEDDEFGRQGVRNYLIQEVQKVYRQQGVDINDKHIEGHRAPDDAQGACGGFGRYCSPLRRYGGYL